MVEQQIEPPVVEVTLPEGAAALVASQKALSENTELVPATKGLRLMGYSVREAHPARTIAYVSITSGGLDVVHIDLAARESETEWFGPDGIACPGGIAVVHEAGTVDINIFHKTIGT